MLCQIVLQHARFQVLKRFMMITFVINDWQPRSQNVYHATGTVGGYFTREPTAEPPGGTYRLSFNSPNSVTMQDVAMGGVITFQRVG